MTGKTLRLTLAASVLAAGAALAAGSAIGHGNEGTRGYGPGMMGGGYGAGGYGHMMGGGYGHMMGGGYGQGPGMMGAGYGCAQGLDAVDLSDEQRTKIRAIQEEAAKAHWKAMEQLHDQQRETRKRVEAVLTREQRDKLSRWDR